MTTRQDLKKSIDKKQVIAPFVCDGLQAIMALKTGFSAAYLTGFGSAATYGLPDLGLISLSQMTEKIRTITYSCDIPLIVDADTGYGNYINVNQTVREYERAGAAALHLEDQLWPKRCGYMNDKQIIDTDEAVSKIKAAVDARKDQNLMIIARTDALAINGWEDVVDRIGKYIEAGADLAFVDGIRTLEDMKVYAEKLAGIPLILNNVPLLPMESIHAYEDFKIVLNPHAMSSAWTGYITALEQIKANNLPVRNELDQEGFNSIIEMLGAREYFAMSEKYSR